MRQDIKNIAPRHLHRTGDSAVAWNSSTKVLHTLRFSNVFWLKSFYSLKQTRKLQLEWLKLCGLIVSLRRGPGEICSDACAESLLRCCGYHDQLPLDKQVKLIKIDKVCPSEPAYLESSCVWLFPGCGSGSAWVRFHSSSWIRIQVKILKNEKWKENIGTNNYIVLYA